MSGTPLPATMSTPGEHRSMEFRAAGNVPDVSPAKRRYASQAAGQAASQPASQPVGRATPSHRSDCSASQPAGRPSHPEPSVGSRRTYVQHLRLPWPLALDGSAPSRAALGAWTHEP
jgi:hypothetical protein